MTAALVHKFKYHLIWEDDKEEQWLNDMARQGLHLVHANVLGNYTFARGEPAEVSYRLDYRLGGNRDANYFQLFKDAGWEHVMSVNGWEYWRKAGAGRDIFTDNGSKIHKYQRILKLAGVSILIAVPGAVSFSRALGHGEAWSTPVFPVVVGTLMYGCLALMAYASTRVFLRIQALRRNA